MQKISVIGLGYVGLPLAVALAKHHSVTGFDINKTRINELKNARDRTAEIDESTLKTTSLHMTCDIEDMRGSDIFIVTVPTPITKDNKPDLSPLESACKTLATVMAKKSIVVFESTVYPGVTEDICGPLLAELSGLKQGKHFFLGYSPERINPGDKVHTIDKITKVVAGENAAITDTLATMYGSINNDNIFKAASIKTAEAAKVIENAQRDVNIAFVNEIATIFNEIGVSVYDVLDAAKTKWNFLPFQPGLVGGHCIGVDPYYLAHLSQELGHKPDVILAGRSTNEAMSDTIANHLVKRLEGKGKRLLMLGLTFKENVPDLRNTKVVDLIDSLKEHGITVDVHDPHANPQEARDFYDIDLLTSFEGIEPYDAVLGAVPHQEYLDFSVEMFEKLLVKNALIADLKAMWRTTLKTTNHKFTYWTL